MQQISPFTGQSMVMQNEHVSPMDDEREIQLLAAIRTEELRSRNLTLRTV